MSGWQVEVAGPPKPPSGKPPTSGGKRKWVIGGVIGVVAIAAIANMGGTSTSPTGATPAPTTAALAAPTEPDATESATPAGSSDATVAPTPSEEPIAEETASAAFKAFVLKGKGNKVAKFKIPEDVAAIAAITEKGSSNFIVESIDSSGSTNELLVNEIGSYKGTVLFDENAGEHSVALKIESNGTWQIAIKPISEAKGWNPTERAAGTGAMVLRLTAPPPDLAVVTIKHLGSSNFVVRSIGTDGSELLVNEIGRYSGESILPGSTVLVVIEADGKWSLTPQ